LKESFEGRKTAQYPSLRRASEISSSICHVRYLISSNLRCYCSLGASLFIDKIQNSSEKRWGKDFISSFALYKGSL
jgi:hypothetical protein